MVAELQISKIRMDGGTQPRAEIDEHVVNEYRQDMLLEVRFPPVTVYFDGTNYWLADGFHRVLAAQGLRRETILADVLQGDRRAAQWYSFGANKTHGLQRKAGDKKRIIEAILNDPEWGTIPLTEIATHVGVSFQYVSQVKLSFKHLKDSSSEKIVTRNGRTYPMNTSNIGRTRDTSSRDEPDPVVRQHRTTEPDDEGTFYNLSNVDDEGTFGKLPRVEPESEIIGVFGEDDSDDAAVLDAMGHIADSMATLAHEAAEAMRQGQGETAVSRAIIPNEIYVGDCLDIMRRMSHETVQLIVTSPPYPGQRGNKMDVKEWMHWMYPRLAEMWRVLNKTGVLALNVNFKRHNGWADHRLYSDFLPMLLGMGYHLIDIYIWHKTNAVPAGDLTRHDISSWEPVFLLAKSENYLFDPVHDHYSPKSLGKLVPDNKTRKEGLAGTYSGGHDKINGSGARQPNVLSLSASGENRPRAIGGSFPLALADRFIRQHADYMVGDVIFDPFAGAGTVLKAAQDLGFTWIGVEIDPEEAEKARGWLSE